VIRIGIIGAGVIGRRIAQIASRHESGAQICGFFTRTEGVEVSGDIPVTASFDTFIAWQPDVVIEAAGQAALVEYGPEVLTVGKTLVPASVGAFANPDVLRHFLISARCSNGKIHLASGAISGLDGIAAARLAGLRRVRYIGTMAGMLKQNAKQATPQQERTLVFSGTARDAALKFPKNANLTLTIALAGLGIDHTEVTLYRDDTASHNTHDLEAEGDFGTLKVSVQGRRISATSPSSQIVAPSLFNAAAGIYYLPINSTSAAP